MGVYMCNLKFLNTALKNLKTNGVFNMPLYKMTSPLKIKIDGVYRYKDMP